MYVDTSAYLALVLGQEGWESLTTETKDAILLSSVLLILEARRNLVRLARQGALDAKRYKNCMERVEHDLPLFELRDLTIDLCQPSPMPAVATPRSLDLAHLRTALWFHSNKPLDRFVTKDTNQEQAAKELGLPVDAQTSST